MLWKPVQCGPCKTDPGKVDVDLKCDLCNVFDNMKPREYRIEGTKAVIAGA